MALKKIFFGPMGAGQPITPVFAPWEIIVCFPICVYPGFQDIRVSEFLCQISCFYQIFTIVRTPTLTKNNDIKQIN